MQNVLRFLILIKLCKIDKKYSIFLQVFSRKPFRPQPNMRNFKGKSFKGKNKTKQPNKNWQTKPSKNQTHSCDSQEVFVLFNNLLFENQNQQNKKPEIITMVPQ